MFSSTSPGALACTAGVFFEYCKRGASGGKDIRRMFNLSAREFVAFCKARPHAVSRRTTTLQRTAHTAASPSPPAACPRGRLLPTLSPEAVLPRACHKP